MKGFQSLSEVAGRWKPFTREVATQWGEFVDYLQLPDKEEYWEALSLSVRSVIAAVRSLAHLGFMTFRPFVLLLWLLSRQLYVVGKYVAMKLFVGGKHVGAKLFAVLRFVAIQLFSGFYHSAKKGIAQTKWAMQIFVRWQYSLTRNEVLLELGLIVSVLAIYMLRRHIRKQKYVERVRREYGKQKRKALKIYRLWLDRISQTSLFLAMLLPHVLYVGVVFAFKMLFPRAIAWLASETYASFLLSVVYPFVWTVALLYEHRHPLPAEKSDDAARSVKTPPMSAFSRTLATKSALKPTNVTTKTFPRTKPSTLASSTAASRARMTTRSMTAKTRSTKEEKTPTDDSTRLPRRKRLNLTSFVSEDSGENNVVGDGLSVEDEARFWLRYWVVFAVYTGLCRFCYYIPIMGRILSRSKFVRGLLAELNLAFFVWIFGLPSALTSSSSNSSDLKRSYETRPLQLILKRLKPILIDTYNGTSEIIKEDTWNMLTEKLKSFLQLAVLVRILSEERKDQILHAFEHSHPVLVPGITLLMPGFTKFGVLYIQSVVPTALSSRKLGASLDVVMSRLEYWVLHVLAGGILEWWSGLLRWVPFSMHAVFLLWWYIQAPNVTQRWFNVFEEELQAFGLLRGGGQKKVNDTVTVAVLKKLVKSLPSGATTDASPKKENNTDASPKKENNTDASKENDTPVQ